MYGLILVMWDTLIADGTPLMTGGYEGTDERKVLRYDSAADLWELNSSTIIGSG